ncbi:MAG: Uma2 family endonuclease, partial [Desulfurobacterium sp.]
PRELIYEMRYGKPIYYRNYDKVLSGEKSLEEVMGSSKLQSLLISLLLKALFSSLDEREYVVLPSEIGFKFAPRSWRNLDIAIFEKKDLMKEGLKAEYVKVAPLAVIEIDTKADLRRYSSLEDYVYQKVEDLLSSGVKKVVWIFTGTRKILVAEKNRDWIVHSWEKDFEILGVKINVKNLLENFLGGN